MVSGTYLYVSLLCAPARPSWQAVRSHSLLPWIALKYFGLLALQTTSCSSEGKDIIKTLKRRGGQERKEERKGCMLQLAMTTPHVTSIKGHFCAFNPYLICYEAFGSTLCQLISYQIPDDNLNSRFSTCTNVICCKQYLPDRLWTCTRTRPCPPRMYRCIHTDGHITYVTKNI